jgi:hypothetical protein
MKYPRATSAHSIYGPVSDDMITRGPLTSETLNRDVLRNKPENHLKIFQDKPQMNVVRSMSAPPERSAILLGQSNAPIAHQDFSSGVCLNFDLESSFSGINTEESPSFKSKQGIREESEEIGELKLWLQGLNLEVS